MHLDPTVFKGIVALDMEGGMGKDNKLPWHLPEDLKQFKAKTFHQPMVMGRKTFESFEKPLPGRLHLVLTRDRDYHYPHPDVKIFHDPRALLSFANGFGGTVWFIGGANIFSLFHDFIDEYHITEIQSTYDTDVKFPISKQDLLADYRLKHSKHGEHEGIHFHINTYVRD